MPVRIRPPPWLFTCVLRLSCPRTAKTRVFLRGHSSASRPPARQGAAAEPVSFRNDYRGISHEVYRYDAAGTRTHVVPTLKQELKEFAQTWFANLRDQGFFGATAIREILSL